MYMLLSLSQSIYTLWRRGDIVEERLTHLKTLEKEQDELKTQLSYTLRPEFIEEEARNKLNMVLPGETMVIVPDASSEASLRSTQTDMDSAVEEFQELPTKRIFLRWFDLFVRGY